MVAQQSRHLPAWWNRRTAHDGVRTAKGRQPPEQQIVSTGYENGGTLAQLARETGGLYFENNNDLLKGIRRAFSDGRTYYLLAYAPKNDNFDGKFRRIKVEVKGRKLQINSKSGYWATRN